MLNINAKESRNLIHQIAAEKTAAVLNRFQKMAQLSVLAQAEASGEKLAAEHINNVNGTNLPGALAVAVMMSKAASREEGPVIAENAQKLANANLTQLPDIDSPGLMARLPAGIQQYLASHHMPGKADLPAGVQEYLASHHMPGMDDVRGAIGKHPLGAAGAAVGVGGAGMLGAMLASEGGGSKKKK